MPFLRGPLALIWFKFISTRMFLLILSQMKYQKMMMKMMIVIILLS